MIWLVSYPRSGNTFVRNIFFEVYGLESGAYVRKRKGYVRTPNYRKFKIVKTHHLPRHTPLEKGDKVIYLYRDGRDSLISSAHRRMSHNRGESVFLRNLFELILVNTKRRLFGGWSMHVDAWLPKADVVIKFEDLIKRPIDEIQKIQSIIELPTPQLSRLPTFESQKKGLVKYNAKNEPNFFRTGKPGEWKQEMPIDQQKVFWELHGKTAKKLGYQEGAKMNLMNKILFRVGTPGFNIYTWAKRYKFSKP